MSRTITRKNYVPDSWLNVFQYDEDQEYKEEDDVRRETEFTREEDWDIEDTLADWREFEDPSYVPSWERNQ